MFFFASFKSNSPYRKFDDTIELTVILEASIYSAWPTELLQFLRLKFIEGPDSFILEACFANSVFDTLRLPFSKENELKVFQYLLDSCKANIERLNILSENEDEKVSPSDDPNLSQEKRISIALARIRIQVLFDLILFEVMQNLKLQ